MRKYAIKIEPEAVSDIQEITDWYNEAKAKLGKKFRDAAIKQINSLNRHPQIFSVRYHEIRCMPVKKFPYLVHFFINEETRTVEILAVISTDRDPKIGEEKTKKHI